MDALGLTQQLSSYIIRPPRSSYNISDLGQSVFQYKGIIYERIDFTVPAGKHNYRIEGSIYVDRFFKNEPRPTVIYLHANSSSRVSVKNYLANLIAHFDVVTFDFRGCGLSQGNYLTLGYLEKYDVRAVIQYVQRKFGNRKYYIWGRSMGAVTAILYTAKYAITSQKLIALVLDSPFSDLQKIIHSLANKKVPLLPTFMLNSAIQNLENHIKEVILKQYNKIFLIRKHKPIQQIPKIRTPIFFIGSKGDQLVSSDHAKSLYENAYCRKQMQMLEGGHNQIRPDHLKLAVVQFLLATLSMKKQPIMRKKIFELGAGRKAELFKEGNNNNDREQQQLNNVNRNRAMNIDGYDRNSFNNNRNSLTMEYNNSNNLNSNNNVNKGESNAEISFSNNNIGQNAGNINRYNSNINEYVRSRSKSNPKNRLFKDKSNPKFKQPNFNNNMGMNSNMNANSNTSNYPGNMNSINQAHNDNAYQKIDREEQIKKTHDQIMNNVLPPGSNRRNNRIFTYASNPDNRNNAI